MVEAGRKSLFLRNVPSELVREAKTAAARRGQPLATIVAEALAKFLGVEGDAPDRPGALDSDMAWYVAHHHRLLKRYRGQYVAIVEGLVVDHGRDFNAVAARVFARFGNRSIYMPRVVARDHEVRVRSPRRSKP